MAVNTIEISGLWKEYLIGAREKLGRTFGEVVTDIAKAPIRRYRQLSGTGEDHNRFWALRDVDLNVQEGEILGVIGRNGAGKTTLLKVLSRITAPTRGRVRIVGRLASLLEIGTGFHPELTGRENIYMNGAILGMTRSEISNKLDEIVAFAEISQFLDTPVKRYSMGMYMRLAFSVAAHLEADILLVDEVLAVGDAIFQEKCLARLGDASEQGRTVLFVSHNMGAISSICTKGVVFFDGKIAFLGNVKEAVSNYMATSAAKNGIVHARNFSGPIVGKVSFGTIRINGQCLGEQILVSPEEAITIEINGESSISIGNFGVIASVFRDGVRVVSMSDAPLGTALGIGRFRSTVEFPPYFLRPGKYSLAVGGERKGGYQWIWGLDLGEFSVLEKWGAGYEERGYGIVNFGGIGSRVQE